MTSAPKSSLSYRLSYKSGHALLVTALISVIAGCATPANQIQHSHQTTRTHQIAVNHSKVKQNKPHHHHHHEHGGHAHHHHEHGGYAHHHHHEHGHAPHWGYANSELPPERWGDIEVNKLCKQGKAQSPINITEVTKPNKANKFELIPAYQTQNFTIKNNGHTIVFDVKDPNVSKLNINGTTYQLLQFHYHVPSEHTVMNAYYPLELHFVHKNDNNGLAVVGVLVDKGDANDQLNKILTNLPSLGAADSTLENFNVSSIMPKGGSTYAYEGSLTTPPCDEQVQWLLKSQPIHASTEQLKILSALYDGNNRPVQPQGNRTVYTID